MSNASAKSRTKGPAPAVLTHDILERLKTQYLPDLRKLRDECMWLQSSLGLEEKDATELQTSETRLVQFVGMVDLVINKIVLLQQEDPRNVNYSKLDFLEANIVKSILPVRARLHEKWKENERSRAVQQSNLTQKATPQALGVGAQSDNTAHSRVPANNAAESSGAAAGSSNKTGKAGSARSQPSSSGSAVGTNPGSTTGSSNSASNSASRAGLTGRSAAVPDFAAARTTSTASSSSSSSSTAFNRGADAVFWAPAQVDSNAPQGPLIGSFLRAAAVSNPKISPLSRGLLRAGVPTAEIVNTAPTAHIGLSAPHRSVLSVSSGPDGQVHYSAGSNYSGFRGVKSRPGAASNPSLRASMMGNLPFSPHNSNNSDAGSVKGGLPRTASNGSLRGAKPGRAQRNTSSAASVASSASGVGSFGALHLNSAAHSSRARADDDTSSQHSDNHSSYSRANLASNAAALAVRTNASPDAAAARRQAAGAAFREAHWAAGEEGGEEEENEGVDEEVEEDALTASIFDDGCESISDLGIYDHVHNADEFDPMLSSRRGDSLSTVPAGWRLHNEISHSSGARSQVQSLSSSALAAVATSRPPKRPFGAVLPDLQSTYLTGGTNPPRSGHHRSEDRKPARTPSGASLTLRNDGSGAGGELGSVAGSTAEEGVMSARRRRKLSLIVPYPRRPRTADYHCSVCSEAYQMMVADNPWWAVYTHRCPHCHMLQVPRIDITAPSNAVELDPNVAALYGDGLSDSSESAYSSDSDEGTMAGDEGEKMQITDARERTGDAGAANQGNHQSSNAAQQHENTAEDEHRGKTARRRGQSAEETPNSTNNAPAPAPSPTSARSFPATADPAATDAQRAADALDREEQSKLLVLMCHARTCTGTHSSDKHAEICKSTKYLMLHIRDCRGLDAQGQECAFPWCRPCKKMLKHLTQCFQPSTCSICSPWGLPPPYQQLRQLQQIPFCPPSAAPSHSPGGALGSASNALSSGAPGTAPPPA